MRHHYTNTATHHVLHAFYVRHNATFGFFHAKGCYFELIAFGFVWRVWATDEYK